MQSEIWKDVPGYSGLYQVSNLGRVMSYRNQYGHGPRIIHGEKTKSGYIQVKLNKERFKVHRLVAMAFIPNPDGLPQINHKNEIKTDNRPDNLEWCDSKYNNNYGLRTQKASVSLSKPVKQLSRDGVLIRVFYGIHEAGRETNIDYRNIYRVLAGQRKTAGGYKWEYAL